MKLVKEILFEKFSEDSDPITDMGIGIVSKIKDLQKQYSKDNYSEKANFSELIAFYISDIPGTYEEKETILEYLLSRAKQLDYYTKDIIATIMYTEKNEVNILKYLNLIKKIKNSIFTDDVINWLLERALINHKYYQVAEYILNEFNVDINHHDGNLLALAFGTKDEKIIKWLLKRGAILNPKIDNYRLLKIAIRNNNETLVKMCAKALLGIK